MDRLTKYLENKNFIQWIFHPTPELESWWERFETEYPEEKQNIQEARNILLAFRTNDRELSEEEKILLFSRVLRQIEGKKKHKKKVRTLFNLMKYAAVAVLFFSIGALLFYKKRNFSPQLYYFSQNLAEPLSYNNTAKLVRPNGESILLKEEKSLVRYNNGGQLVVNTDTIKKEDEHVKGNSMLNQLIIPFGKTSELFLSDGTHVYLNAGSRLVFPETFSGSQREVFLTGEAFFEVSHDKKHPFIVRTTDVSINVLGTKFNVCAYPSDNIIETVLAEGKVNIQQNYASLFDESTDLEPNQLAAFNKMSRETNVKNVDVDNYTLWKDGMFKFESTDFNRVTKKLERFYDIRIQFAEPLIGTLRISGKLELGDNMNEALERIAKTASVKITQKGEKYYEISR